jgi:hypothetical protein
MSSNDGVRISQLPVITTPLADATVFPVVQDGATSQATMAQLQTYVITSDVSNNTVAATNPSTPQTLAEWMEGLRGDVSDWPEFAIGAAGFIGPYIGYRTKGYQYINQPDTHTYSQTNFVFARDTLGSGVNGPTRTDTSLLVTGTKIDYLTSTVDGEIDVLQIMGRQGRLGDIGGLIINIAKVRNGDSGDGNAPAAGEFRVATVLEDGTVVQAAHALPVFLEFTGAVSGGKGYGHSVETRAGVFYAAYYGGSVASGTGPYEAPNSFDYLLSGSTRRDASYVYFAIEAEKGDYNKGAILQGLPANRRITDYDPNANKWSIQDEAANVWLTLIEGALTATTSVFDAVGRLQAVPRSTTAALQAIGDAINTTNKFTGKLVINTTTGTFVTAAGGGAGGGWLNLDGTLAYTPV